VVNLSLNYGEVHGASLDLLAFMDSEEIPGAVGAAASILSAARIIADHDIGPEAEIALVRDVFQIIGMYFAEGRPN
jgi:hypothetical protein